jgi:hypothetical protein
MRSPSSWTRVLLPDERGAVVVVGGVLVGVVEPDVHACSLARLSRPGSDGGSQST